MPLYEFVLVIQDGAACHEHRELVVAAHDELAMRYAREFASRWRPHTQYDQQNDIYVAADGWPQWTIARCSPITHLSVAIAGKKRIARYTPVLWDDGFPEGLRRGVGILRAMADPSLADCSLRWILADYLNLDSRELADIVRAVSLVQQSMPDGLPIPVPQGVKVAA